MRKIVAGLFSSLDGVVEAPETWTPGYFSDEAQEEIGAQMAASDTLLLGRVTYEEFAAYWPGQAPDANPVAGFMNSTPKLVASTTLKQVEWENSTLIKGDVADELAKLKEQPGKNISITGSVNLVGSLLRSGVLDELRVLTYPIVLGHGKRLFEDGGDPVSLTLVDSRAHRNGVMSLVYEPAGA